jgi:hypothetical protein
MRKLLLILPMSGALLLSTNLFAQDRDHGRDHDDRAGNRHHLYDRHHKDYHDFDEHEHRAWRMYSQQRHRGYIDWDRASERQREDYWKWRHNHSDAVLQINVR